MRHIALMILALLCSFAVQAATTWVEQGLPADGGAGDGTPTSPAQETVGVGALDQIVGALTPDVGPGASDKDVDAYLICVFDPENFSAKTAGTNTAFDTQLFLFTLDGVGVYANDDVNQTDKGINFNTDKLSELPVGYGDCLGCGLYILAISGYNEDPSSDSGPIFPNTPFDEVVFPKTLDELAVWHPSGHFNTGPYTILLTGAGFASDCENLCDGEPVEEPIPEPATAGLLLLGLAGLFMRRRAA